MIMSSATYDIKALDLDGKSIVRSYLDRMPINEFFISEDLVRYL